MFDIQQFDQIHPPTRLLMGPGPVNADPRVLRALSCQMIGQFDPAMLDYMDQTMALYRAVFQTRNSQTLLIDGTSRAGIEALLVSVLKPGDKVLVPVFGRFGLLLCEIAKRCQADVHVIHAPWGEVFDPNQIEDQIKQIRPRMLLTVHGDTSTTMLQPLAELGALCQQYEVLFYTDATASLGGNTLLTDTWHLDAVSAGLQKCLSGPPGIAPITVSPMFAELINRRKHTELGLRSDQEIDGDDCRIASNYFDLEMIGDYWGSRRLNHHTESTSMLFAARECARILLQEGLEVSIERHRLNSYALQRGLEEMGLTVFGQQQFRMNNIVGVYIPSGIHDQQVRDILLEDFSIEIGSAFGALQGKIWRIGTMGYNARKECVLQTLVALEAVLNRFGYKTVQGAGLQAAWDVYSQKVV